MHLSICLFLYLELSLIEKKHSTSNIMNCNDVFTSIFKRW